MNVVTCLWSSGSVVTDKYQGTSVIYFFIIGYLKAFHRGLLHLF